MQLNLDIIQDYLPKEYQVRRYGLKSRECTFQRPLLYETGSNFQDGTLYVVQAEALPQCLPPQSVGMICVGNRIPQIWLSGGIQLLVVQDSPGILTVFNRIHSMYNSFDAWDSVLRDELEKDTDFDIRQILYFGSRLLGRSISVLDHTLHGIFRTEVHSASSGNIMIDIIDEPHPISMEYSEKIKEVCRLERVIKVPYLTSLEANGERFYCNNLYPIGSFSGCITILEGKQPFLDSDYPLMDHFFACFQKAFLKHLRSYGQMENSSLVALQSLLEHTPIGVSFHEHLSLQPGETWVCFKLRECQGERSLIKEYMYATLNGILPRTVYSIIHHGEIVGLFRNQNNDTASNDSALRFFEDTLHRMGYICGVSNPFTDLQLIEDYMRQAGYAVDNGNDQDRILHFFCDHALSYMLDACIRELSLDSLYSQGLLQLQSNDQKRGTEYIKTLDTYLRNEMHITQTAEELYIHRSSLIKRLDKIQRLLEDDLKDPDTRLYYRICLALLNNKR